MRCFFSVDIPNDMKKKILNIQDDIRNISIKAKYVEKENLHFTLSFLGEINSDEVTRLITNLTRELENMKSFKINLKSLGYFGSSQNIRNVWIGISEGKDQFYKLFISITKHTNTNDSRFSPHVTLCRIKSSHNMNALLSYVNKMKDREFGIMNVIKVYLKKSILSQKGPEYTNIHTFRLGD